MKVREVLQAWPGIDSLKKAWLQNPHKNLSWLPALLCLAVTALVLTVFFHTVQLKPQVEENFFFASDDPQFKSDRMISEIFPQPPQMIVGVKGDIRSPEYMEKVRKLSDTLAALPDVFVIQSLTRGPENLEDALNSPLWKRIIFSRDGQSSFIFVFMKKIPDEAMIRKVEKIRDEFQGGGTEIMLAGAPYATELISRKLFSDLRFFSLAAFFIFAIVLFIIFKSWAIILGTLIACLNAGALTLILSQWLHIPIGPLTANLSTMVFVMTLSPIVFLTFNWKKIQKAKPLAESAFLLWEAVKLTIMPSFWSMATAIAGFMSLLSVQAKPMRQLGISGAIGAVVAFLAAYMIYPWFLLLVKRKEEKLIVGNFRLQIQSFFSQKHHRIAGAILVLTLLSIGTLRYVNTDPSLLAYFKKGSELWNGLEYIDRNNGSSPLKIVVSDRQNAPFNSGEEYVKLWALHEALEKNPAVGNVVSLPVVLAEGKRSPFTFLISTGWLVKIMESPRFGEIAKYFINGDHTQAFFVLTMHEAGRKTSRLEIIDGVEKTVRDQGYLPVLMGGAYMLQAKLAELLTSSLIFGVLHLLLLFTAMGWLLSRSFQVSGALLASLCAIPLSVLCLTGIFKAPLDVISAPGINLAIGMGVDAMIYMIAFARQQNGKMNSWETWAEACAELWQPIGTSLFVICAGFGIFLFSNFPPTQRFGLFVICGSLMSALTTLFVFPWLCALSIPRKFILKAGKNG